MTSVSHKDTFLWDFVGYDPGDHISPSLQPGLLDLLSHLVQVTGLLGCNPR